MLETDFSLRTSVMRGKTPAVLHDDDGMLPVPNDFAKKPDSFSRPLADLLKAEQAADSKEQT